MEKEWCRVKWVGKVKKVFLKMRGKQPFGKIQTQNGSRRGLCFFNLLKLKNDQSTSKKEARYSPKILAKKFRKIGEIATQSARKWNQVKGTLHCVQSHQEE